MCPHTHMIYVSSYTPVAADAYWYPLRACVSLYYHVSACCCTTAICVSCYYICVPILLCVSSYYYICPHTHTCATDPELRARPLRHTLRAYIPHTLRMHTCIPHTLRMHTSAHSTRIHTSYATYAYLICCACRRGPRQAANLKVHHMLRMHTSYAAHAGKARGRQPI